MQAPKRRKTKRVIATVLGLLIVIGVLAAVKASQISLLISNGKRAQKAGPPPEAVASALARSETWQRSLPAVGTVSGERGVTVGNDAPGIVRKIRFESGEVVKTGDVLVELDASVERAQLASAKARRDLARTTAQRSRALAAANVLSRAQLDVDEAELEAANTNQAAVQAQIEKKIVRAPFAGRLGIRAVNLGQYLAPGTPITSLQEAGAVYVDFTLPQQELGVVKQGLPVQLSVAGAKNGSIAGSLSAIDPEIDEATRSIRLRASVPNERDELQAGMFVNVSVIIPTTAAVVIVPLTAVVHAAYGDSVFVIEDKMPGSPGMAQTPDGRKVWVVRQQFVRLGESRGDFVVVQEGVKPGERVVSAGAFKLRNGAPVVIDDGAQPKPELSPRPENR